MAQLELWNKGSKGHSWHGSLEGSGGDLVQLTAHDSAHAAD